MAYLNKDIVKAFQRLEQRERKKELDQIKKKKAAEAAQVREAAERTMLRKKRIERLTVGMTVLFAGGIIALVWYTQKPLITNTYHRVSSLGRSGGSLNEPECSSRATRNTPRCLERLARERSAEDSWDGIQLNEKGKSAPFTLHRKSKKEAKPR